MGEALHSLLGGSIKTQKNINGLTDILAQTLLLLLLCCSTLFGTRLYCILLSVIGLLFPLRVKGGNVLTENNDNVVLKRRCVKLDLLHIVLLPSCNGAENMYSRLVTVSTLLRALVTIVSTG